MRIKHLRESYNMRQADLAEKIGVSVSSLSKYELEQVEPSLTIMRRLSDVFHVSIDYIMGLTDNPHIKQDDKGIEFLYEVETQTDFVYLMGSNGQRKKYYVPPEKAERLRKLIEAGLPEVLEE